MSAPEQRCSQAVPIREERVRLAELALKVEHANLVLLDEVEASLLGLLDGQVIGGDDLMWALTTPMKCQLTYSV